MKWCFISRNGISQSGIVCRQMIIWSSDEEISPLTRVCERYLLANFFCARSVLWKLIKLSA
ncbi:hypothetical protein, partial [Citrobacter portucalensis]